MEFRDCFAGDYRDARARFRAAADAAGARLETYENPARGPDGRPVHTDIALIGDDAAASVLLVNSATHGVEGFCGSAIQVGWLRSGAPGALPEGVRVVLVHAINPHGFAWVRRVTEDNVDLNRNFFEPGADHKANAEYDALHGALVPERWDAASIAACDRAFDDYVARHDSFALQAAITRGQYDHADGLFYGGREATWSNRTFHAILERFVKGARRVLFLDLHTGLGRYGAAEMIGGGARDRMIAWFGEGLHPPPGGRSSSAPVVGVIGGAVRRGLGGAEVTSITVEFGTYPVRDVLRALQADNWVHLKGDPDSEQGRVIKADIRRRLYPDEDDWKEMVHLRAGQILRRAVAGLAAP